MNSIRRFFKLPFGWQPLVCLSLLAGCSGGVDPVLGTPGAGLAPTITATTPANSTPAVTGVATNSSVFVTFGQPMAPATINTSSFTLACPAGTPVAASVSYDAATQVATLTPTTALSPNTVCVASVTSAAQTTAGFGMPSPYTWSFTTTGLADATRPTVSVTTPADAAPAAPNNTRVSATFSEAMNPTTVNGSSFTLTNTTLGTAVTGTVSYSVASRTATFTPTTPALLPGNNLFTATLTTVATDLAGNALAGNSAVLPAAGNHVWTFTTSAVSDSTAPTVSTISPADGATAVCLTRVVSASFNEPMNAATLNTSTFIVSNNGVAVAGTVSYDAASQLASFTTTSAAGFAPSTAFVVTIESGATGVADLAGNALASDRVWGFTTGTAACAGSFDLATAASFGAFGGAAGVTNHGVNTVVNGNLGSTAACTLITGFHDAANTYDETPLDVGAVNGAINCGPPAPGTTTTLAIATQAHADALAAYNTLAAVPPGSDPAAGQLGGLVLAPATYTSAGGTFDITSGDLTLDAQGNADAVWVFQSASALTVGLSATPRRVLLINGAQARNVFWQVGSAARIEDGSTMVGTIIAPAGVTISTMGQTAQTTLIGRALGLTASVTMVNTTIVAP